MAHLACLKPWRVGRLQADRLSSTQHSRCAGQGVCDSSAWLPNSVVFSHREIPPLARRASETIGRTGLRRTTRDQADTAVGRLLATRGLSRLVPPLYLMLTTFGAIAVPAGDVIGSKVVETVVTFTALSAVLVIP